MQIGYVTFNTEERQKVMKVLQMVRDQTAIDELGLGRIRDAFANEMFPGMSTLQRRAKYFAVLPSLYYEATKVKYRSVQEVHRQIIHWEIRLTEMLMNGAAEDDRNGITGSSMLEQAKHDESKFVRYDPTYIYQTGLRMYGMIRSNANLERVIYERSEQLHKLPAKYVNDELGGDADELSGDKQIFATSGEVYNFEKGDMIPVTLSRKEAAFIKQHIEQAPGSKHSMLAYLLRENVPVCPDYMDLQNHFGTLPARFQEQYLLALHFTHWAYYMQLRYRYLFAVGNQNKDKKRVYEEAMAEEMRTYPALSDSSRMGMVLGHVTDFVTDKSILLFCQKAAAYIEKQDWMQLDALIRVREKNIKGNRCKIDNPKYKNYEMGMPGRMYFRWNEIVYQVINEIRTALWHSEETH